MKLTPEQIAAIDQMVLRRMDNTGEDHVTASAHIRLYLEEEINYLKGPIN